MLASVLGWEYIHISPQKVPDALSLIHPQQKSTLYTSDLTVWITINCGKF